MKKLLTLALAAVLSLMLMMPVSAADSLVTVEFSAGSGPVDPVDPDEPSQPLEPPGGGTGETGNLTLNYISPLAFGSRTLSSKTEVYHAKTMKPFVQVTDLRGTGQGWQLRAVALPFEASTGAVLTGAEIALKNGQALSANMDAPAPTPEPNVVLPTDGESEQLVFSATEHTGLGTWIDRWYPSNGTVTENDNVTLTVPGSVTKALAYTATIRWTLVDAP